MKTFTSKPGNAPVTFMVDEDEFEAIPANQMPGGVLEAYFKRVNKGEVFEAQMELFEFVLTEASYKLFIDRYTAKNDKPITITMLGEIAVWLLGDIYMGDSGETDQTPSTSETPKKRPRSSATDTTK